MGDMNKKASLLTLLLLGSLGALQAQEADTSRWHFAVQTSVETAWGGLLPHGYRLQGRPAADRAPRRHPVAMATSTLTVGASYRASERLWLWGSVSHIGGLALERPVNATALSGGFAYALGDRNMLEVHFRFVHDHYGTLMGPPYGHLYYGSLAPGFDLYHGPWPF